MGALPTKAINRMTTVEEAERHAVSGDLILFRGNIKNAFSHAVAALQAPTPWTHVGVLIRGPNNALYVFHSSIDDVSINTYIIKGAPRNKTGPKLTPFKDAIKGYSGERCAVRYAILPDNNRHNPIAVAQHNRKMWGRFDKFFKKHGAKPYEEHYIQLLGAVLHANPHADTSSFFCSEMVAQFFIEIGWLPADEDDEHYQPSNNYDLRWLSSPHMTVDNHDDLQQTMVLGFDDEIDLAVRNEDGSLIAYFDQPHKK
jgi:hypothetical protein